MKRNSIRRREEMDKPDIDLSILIQHFEVHNRSEGKSPRTVQWYNEVLYMFRGWLEEQELRMSVGRVISPKKRLPIWL
ncbi:MAG: hypothetical protein ACE5JL_09770 [Dehalococcoidia bacterium]